MLKNLKNIKTKDGMNPAAEASTDKALLYFDHPTKGRIQIPCQFNPQTLVISKTATWQSELQAERDSPQLTFSGGAAATFSLDLFFDTTTLGNIDVRVFTNSLLLLTMRGAGAPNQQKSRPPVVGFIWGRLHLFRAIVEGVTISYIMFLKNGTPVRARANVSFKQYTEDMGAQNPTSRTDPRKTYVVQPGDRLDTIAYHELGAADRWRAIAEANDLADPLNLRPGQVLKIPLE